MAWPGKLLSTAEPRQIYYYCCYTHTDAHTHTHTWKCSLISPLSERIRWKQISSAPVTSPETGLLLHRRYQLVSSTSTYTNHRSRGGKKKHFLFSLFLISLSLSLFLSTIFFSMREDKFKRSKLENQMRALGSRWDLQSCRPASQSLIHHVPQVVNSSSICKCFQILANLYAPRFIMENQL